MSRINDLIKDLSTSEVKYEKLGNVCDVIVGFSFKANLFKSEGLPIVKTTNIQDGYIDETSMVYFDENDYSNNLDNYIIYPNDIVLGMSGTIKVGINNTNKNYYLNQRVCKFKPHKELNNKFLYYTLSNSIGELFDATSGSSVKNLSNENIKSLQIAVPPLEVQCEIVHILDDFTLLSAELSAELKARQKQYEYYRDNLFENDNNAKLYSLKDLCLSIKDGMHNLPKNTLDKTEYPILSAQNINDGKINNEGKRYVDKETYLKENKRTNIEKGDVLLTIVATIGRTAVVEENNKFLLQRSVCVLKPKDIVNPYYLKFYLDTYKVQNYMITNAHGSAQAGLYLNQVAEILVPVPSIEKQSKIVKILTNFDRITNDISQGLPAEIEARQKQYEYYRDKLLTFKELVNEG